MIVLLSTCFISWSQNPRKDSVLIAIEDLRVANAKMVELDYEKAINEELRGILKTDSALINALQLNLNSCENTCQDSVNKVKKQRNIAIGAGSGASAFFLLLLLLIAL